MLSEPERIEALAAARKLVATLEKTNVLECERVDALKTANSIVNSLETVEDATFKFVYYVRTLLLRSLLSSS